MRVKQPERIWIIDPDLKLLQVGVLTDGGYATKIYEPEDKAPVSVLDGCMINLADVFNEE